MLKAQTQSSLGHLTELEDRLLDRQLVLSGTFKEEVARLLAVQKEARETLGMVDTVKAADAYRADADKYAAATRAAADKVAADARGAMTAANAKMDAALTKEKTVASREEQALALMADYEKKAAGFDAACAKREAALASREAALGAAQEQLAKDRAELAARQAAMLDKLKAAQALAASV